MGIGLDDWADIATIVGAIIATLATTVAAAGLIYTGRQIQHARNVAAAELLLHIDELMSRYDDVQAKLHDKQKLDESDQFRTLRYMGLMERIKVVLDRQLIDIATVDHLYGYRVRAIMKHPFCRKLVAIQKQGWRQLIELNNDLDQYRSKISLDQAESDLRAGHHKR